MRLKRATGFCQNVSQVAGGYGGKNLAKVSMKMTDGAVPVGQVESSVFASYFMTNRCLFKGILHLQQVSLSKSIYN